MDDGQKNNYFEPWRGIYSTWNKSDIDSYFRHLWQMLFFSCKTFCLLSQFLVHKDEKHWQDVHSERIIWSDDKWFMEMPTFTLGRLNGRSQSVRSHLGRSASRCVTVAVKKCHLLSPGGGNLWYSVCQPGGQRGFGFRWRTAASLQGEDNVLF